MFTKDEQAAACVEREESAALADHLVRLPGTDHWALWKWVGLRAAGFAAQGVLALGSHESAEAADELLHAEDEAEQLWEDALDAVRAQLDTATGARRELFVKAVRQLNKGKVPQLVELQEEARNDDSLAEIVTKIKEFEAAYNRVTERGTVFEQRYADEMQRNSEALRAAVSDERFREAIIWQNRRALHTGINSLLHKPSTTTSSKYRQHQELAGSYLQRYCTKNDSIGFFGPVGWARFAPEAESLNVRPGRSLLSSRGIYIECWAIDALLERLYEDADLRQWLVPRRMPFVKLEGRKLSVPIKGERELSVVEALVLAACDGRRPAKSIAAELHANHPSELSSETQVYDVLKDLHDEELIAWPPGIPYGSHPERILRRQLEGIGDEMLRARALASLDELEAARDEVGAAAGDIARLDEAFIKLEETFNRLTNVASTRAEGKTYAGRTVVYEDCQRDIEVELGASILESLGPPLSLLLDSARWLTFQVAGEYRKAFQEIYVELVRDKQSSVIEASDFWQRAQRLLFGSRLDEIKNIATVFQERWAKIFSLPDGQRRVTYTSEQLRAQVTTAFDTPGTGWQYARYHSPDIMIAAESVEAIKRGDYQLVMGELHIAIHTLGWAFFLEQHPAPDEFFRGIDSDLPAPRVLLLPPKSWPGLTSRNFNILSSTKDYPLDFSKDSAAEPTPRDMPIASLVMEDKGDGLILRTRDGQLHFDIVEVFAYLLSTEIVDWFKMFKRGAHQPRVTIDRLVVQRESWAIPAVEMTFAHEREDADRFLEARRFQQQHGMPRHVFAKVPVEVKPVYVDFESALYVNMFGRLIRRSVEAGGDEAQVTISEMLPGMEQLWLPDAEGNRYTSELRIVALNTIGS